MKNKYVHFVIYVIAFVVLWNILEYLYVTWFSKTPFSISWLITLPVALVTGYLNFLYKKE